MGADQSLAQILESFTRHQESVLNDPDMTATVHHLDPDNLCGR